MNNDIISFILPLAIFIFVFYFLMIRPQKKEAEKRATMLRAIKTGDKIETVARVIGVVTLVEGDQIVVNISEKDRCEVRMGLEGVARVITETATQAVTDDAR